MSKIASVIAAVTVVVSLSAASANACENFVGASSRGNHTIVDAETRGDHYVSLDHEGDWGALQARVSGRCNKYVAGQYGQGNTGKADIVGRRNVTGLYQETDDAAARIKVRGAYNEVAVIQQREGSGASVKIVGIDTTVVVRQH